MLHFCSSAGLYELATHNCSCNDEQGCCHLATDSSSAAKGMHRFVGMVAVLHFCRAVELQQLIGVVAMMSKAVATLPLTAAVLQRACTGCKAWLLCCTSAVLQGCMNCKKSWV